MTTQTAPRPTAAQQESWATYLDEDETLLWEGAPGRGIRVRPANIVMSLFGVFFFGFAVFWTYMAGSMGGSDDPLGGAFALFGLPFVAVGAYLLIGQYFWDAYERSRTRYALSSHRAFVAKQTFGRQLRTFPIRPETEIELQPGPEGSIYFAKEVTYGGKHGRTRHEKKHGFEFIADADAVYRLIRDVKRGKQSEPQA